MDVTRFTTTYRSDGQLGECTICVYRQSRENARVAEVDKFCDTIRTVDRGDIGHHSNSGVGWKAMGRNIQCRIGNLLLPKLNMWHCISGSEDIGTAF